MQRLLLTTQTMPFSSAFKGDYFKKSSSEVPEVKLPNQPDFDGDSDDMDHEGGKPKVPPSPTLRAKIREMERTEDEENLYSVYKASRMTRRERDSNLERFLHPDLVANDRVSIKKFKRDNFKRGLLRHLGEQPFPVQAKIGPYEVPDAVFGAKNYYWCSCGLSRK